MKPAVMRAKFRINTVTRDIGPNGQVECETVTLTAVSGDSEENKQWARWTPSGLLSLKINNPDAIGKLTKGHEFFVDLIPCGTFDVAGTSYPVGQTEISK